MSRTWNIVSQCEAQCRIRMCRGGFPRAPRNSPALPIRVQKLILDRDSEALARFEKVFGGGKGFACL